MSDVNKYGLRRSELSAEQKRLLRQEAGFGCVICGTAIGDYEHIDPEFADAQEHDVSKMAFLCIQCHGKVTRGHLSKQSVLAAKQSPKSRTQGFSFEAFDVGAHAPAVHFGPMVARHCQWAIRINEKPVFWIREPESEGAPFRLNAQFRKSNGELVFSIIDNEWRVRNENWDAEVKGPRIIIRNGPRKFALVLRTEPPSEIFIERMDMSIEGYVLRCDGENFSITAPTGRTVVATALECVGCLVAVDASDGSIVLGAGGGSVSFSGSMGGNAGGRAIDTTIRRNARCPCGSGKRYKHCCGSFAAS